MTEPLGIGIEEPPDRNGAFPRLNDEERARLLALGALRQVLPGEVLFKDGDDSYEFIGADPRTDWLRGHVAMDEHGFVLAGRDIPDEQLSGFDGDRPYFLEASQPGIFAVGDARSGSVKQVASAVGEGSMAVRLVHQRLAAW